MTSRDYIAISAAIAATRADVERNTAPGHRTAANTALDALSYRLGTALARDNQRFDIDRFLTAAGVK
jgi:hypothetical protein